jgi:hypothetical protein
MEKWAYLEAVPAPDAPVSDNPSGLYCPACRACGAGMVHCAWPEYCGGMRRMKPKELMVDKKVCEHDFIAPKDELHEALCIKCGNTPATPDARIIRIVPVSEWFDAMVKVHGDEVC